VLVAGVVCFAVEGYLSIRGGVTSAGFGVGVGLGFFGTFLVRGGDGFSFLISLLRNASIPLYGEG
jgi:hypothetical protein